MKLDVGERNREDVVVVRFGRDRHGDPLVSSYAEHTLLDCLIAPSSSTEDLQSGEQVSSRLDVYVAPGSDVRATDRLRRSSDPTPASGAPARVRAPWQVIGDPARWGPGTVITIERSSG